MKIKLFFVSATALLSFHSFATTHVNLGSAVCQLNDQYNHFYERYSGNQGLRNGSNYFTINIDPDGVFLSANGDRNNFARVHTLSLNSTSSQLSGQGTFSYTSFGGGFGRWVNQYIARAGDEAWSQSHITSVHISRNTMTIHSEKNIESTAGARTKQTATLTCRFNQQINLPQIAGLASRSQSHQSAVNNSLDRSAKDVSSGHPQSHHPGSAARH